jgi:hypothetical protein
LAMPAVGPAPVAAAALMGLLASGTYAAPGTIERVTVASGRHSDGFAISAVPTIGAAIVAGPVALGGAGWYARRQRAK